MNRSARGAIILRPREGRRLALPDRGAVATLKAVGRDTRGRLAVVESAPAPGAPGLPMHRHHRSDEALYILEGTVTVRASGRVEALAAGSFAFIPRGTAHMFWNPGPRRARVLVIFAPAGVERFLEETAEAFAAGSGQPDPRVLQEIRAKHDTEMVRSARASSPSQRAAPRARHSPRRGSRLRGRKSTSLLLRPERLFDRI